MGLAAARPTNCKEDPRGASYDRDQLVHVPNCLFVPNVRLRSSESSRIHSSGLLLFGHYFQMWSWHRHLPDLLRQVWQEGSLAMTMCMRYRACLALASFSSLTRRLSCNDHVHEIPSLSCSRKFFKSYRHFWFLVLMAFLRLRQQKVT